MQPDIRLDRNIIAVQVDQVVHVLVDLVAPAAPPSDRAPIDLVLVLDRSGSMSGDPLRSVREAAAKVLRSVGPDDRVAVVAFDDQVTLVLPLVHHADTDQAAAAVRSIHSGGSTNLSAGWFKALELLDGSPRPHAVRRIVLLTDGHANAGLRDIEQLGPIVRAGRDRGITTSCIGFADGYDERFLAGVADSGGGDDYWCAGPDQANDVFTAELGVLANLVAQNVSVEIRPTPAVAAAEVLNDFPVVEVPGGRQVSLGDAMGGERRRVVTKFHLRPASAQGDVHVADLVIRWVSMVGDPELHTVTVPVRLTAGDGEVVIDAGVTEEVVRLQIASERRAAQETADRGDHRGASELLRRAAEAARPYPALRNEVDMLNIDSALLADGLWSETKRKESHARSRGISKRRRKDYSSDHEPSIQPDIDPDDQSPSGQSPT
ncbi:MAG: hypothetical protein RI900_1696 [Actinomycetota bacterium]|jgi:Ca-activated chloride channel family protein